MRRREPGAELLGSAPPGWGALRWLNGPPVRLTSMQGKPALIRWWTDSCSCCAATVPALNRLHDEFADDGLSVVGMYYPNPPRPMAANTVAEAADQLRIGFPVAIDFDWRVLRKWWLDTGARDGNAVTFLLDRDGRIRLIHPGPCFCLEGEDGAVEDFKAIRTKVRRLLNSSTK